MRALMLAVCMVPAVAAAAPWEKSGIKDWAAVPKAGPEPKWKPPKPQRFTLQNGLKVVVVENHKLPLVSFVMVVPGAGTASDPAGQGGLAAFTADLLDEGAGELSALAISDRIDQLGADISFASGTDAGWASLAALKKTLDDSLLLWTELVTTPSFPAAEVKRVHGDRLTAVKLRRDRPREIAALVLAGALYGPASPYGHPGSGHADDLGKLTGENARDFYQAHWNPLHATLVVAGDITRAELEPKLAALGAWSAPRAETRPAPPAPAAASPRLIVVDRPGAEQTDVRIGIVAPPRSDPRYVRFEVLRTVLGDGFTSRLVQRLREQLGYTYGISARVDWRLAASPFTIATGIFTPETLPGLGEIRAIVKALAATAVPKDELEKAKLNIVRAFPQQFETNEGIASAYAELALFGLPDSWFAKYLAEVRKVKAKDVQEMAKTIIPEGKLTFVLVGDLKTLGALDSLGLGAAVQYDADGRAPQP